jgi:hypothetical protein
MDENKAALVKKIGEGNKSLSVIVAEEKLAKFKSFSQSLSLSMGWLLNQAIDRYLESGSTDIFKTTIGDGGNIPKIANIGASDLNVEELVKSSIDSYLLKTTIGNTEPSSPSISREDVEELLRTSIETVSHPINSSIEELRSELSEVSEFARNLQGEIVKVKKPLAIV